MSVVTYTEAGLAKLISAKNEGLKGAITHIAAGSAKYTPSVKQTKLKDEKQRVEIVDYEELGPTTLRLAARFDGDLEYEVGEVGFYLDDETLLAVFSAPDTTLTYKAPGTHWIERFTLDLTPLPSDSVTIEVGVEDVNLMMTEEFATMATSLITQHTLFMGLLFRVGELEKQ